MGYYTTYNLEIIYGDDYFTEYKKEIGELSGYGDPFDDSCKWYDHDKHMVAYSKKHPKTLFKLIGEGEDSSDLWHKYYLNGKMQVAKAKIIYPHFDEKLLD